MAVSTAHGILKDYGLRPHKVKTFKVSRDPRFGIKTSDVIGPYLDPPDHAVVFTVEKRRRSRRSGGRKDTCP